MRLALPLLLAIAAPAIAADPGTNVGDIPAPIRAMLDAALASGNETDVSTIVKYARSADPGSADAVQRIASQWHDRRTAANVAKVRAARFLDLWTGKVELGGSRTTGNSDTAGVTASVDVKREGIDWRQKFHAQVDYQENLGITTREHFLASYEPNYKLNERAYLYGQLQYESDRFLGYTDRVSGSLGAGYSAIKTPRVQLDVELGPAYRYTAYTDDNLQASIAARGSIDLKWKLLRNVTVSQNAAAYVQRFNSTLASTTSLSAHLFGPLSAQLSYNVQYESEPPAGSVSTDTTSRAGLVYAF
jgi:putative salt-induced outer membrane protein